MQFCMPHWGELKKAVDDAGMGHLVHKTGEELFTQVVEPELEGEKPAFDPLLSCNMMIMSNALQIGGMYIMFPKPDGTPHCPVCEADAHEYTGWIQSAVDSCKEHCIKEGLIPPVQ
jgi:hypothetical protein